MQYTYLHTGCIYVGTPGCNTMEQKKYEELPASAATNRLKMCIIW